MADLQPPSTRYSRYDLRHDLVSDLEFTYMALFTELFRFGGLGPEAVPRIGSSYGSG